MLRKSEYFEQIGKYLDAELEQAELREFELQLEADTDLAGELNLHMEVEQAIGEKDIASLRENLNRIVLNQSDDKNSTTDAFSFGLAEELASCQNLGSQGLSEATHNMGHSFPKIHLYQHKIAGKETIHHLYKDQAGTGHTGEETAFSAYDEELFGQVQQALEEGDILEIRANLKQIARNMPEHQYSGEEIDDYVSGNIAPELKGRFEKEMGTNARLATDVKLFAEADLALAECDITALRASLNEILRPGSASMPGTKDIEGYINNELSEGERASFEAGLGSNRALAAEIELARDIDTAIKEDDIMRLRGNLQGIAGAINAENRAEQSFAGRFKAKKALIVAVAASLAILLGITGLLSKQPSQGDLYRKYHSAYEAPGAVRSASMASGQALATALQRFDDGDYRQAIGLLQKAVSDDQKNMAAHFYAGAALQETGEYGRAIDRYQTVIAHGDNLFTEQAEWYAALCLLKTNENQKAYIQFDKIAKKEGFYRLKAKAVIRKIKHDES
jgi:anti-sigma factor RsiW